ncbi:hypothetical protein G6L37_01310 [Agrobacterium rubi]|nr:hypothetical protein [Agrobacterium rubi]NTF24030.1 hypothetical protein [Agrobacterium rubi]
MRRTSWKEMIAEALEKNGESWRDIVAITLSDCDLVQTFEVGFDGPSGRPFSAWTQRRVYFPLVYDGLEWCGSAPRNPDGIPLTHQGGS